MTHFMLHVRTNGDSPVSWRRHTCGGNTVKAGTRARDTHDMWSSSSVGCELGPSTSARTRTRAEVNVRPRSLVQKTKQASTQEDPNERSVSTKQPPGRHEHVNHKALDVHRNRVSKNTDELQTLQTDWQFEIFHRMTKFTTVNFESLERFILSATHSSEMSQSNILMWAKPMTGKNAAGDINFHRCQKAFEKLESPWPQPSTARGHGRPRRDVRHVPEGATKPCPE